MTEEIREVVADLPFKTDITDLHGWQVGKGKFSCIVSIATAGDLTPDSVRKLLGVHEELAHITVEMNRITARPQ